MLKWFCKLRPGFVHFFSFFSFFNKVLSNLTIFFTKSKKMKKCNDMEYAMERKLPYKITFVPLMTINRTGIFIRNLFLWQFDHFQFFIFPIVPKENRPTIFRNIWMASIFVWYQCFPAKHGNFLDFFIFVCLFLPLIS